MTKRAMKPETETMWICAGCRRYAEVDTGAPKKWRRCGCRRFEKEVLSA